jgi:hypothetical protein
MIKVSSLGGLLYRVTSAHEYSIQMASTSVPGGAFSLDARFYSASNDWFGACDQLEGSNLVYYGSFLGATNEPGEPIPQVSNTVWMAWAAPFTGHANFNMGKPTLPQYANIFTGPAFGSLQPVRVAPILNGTNAFLAKEGEVYHFQFCGGATNFIFLLWETPFGPVPNDNFAQALAGKGRVFSFPTESVIGATMEPGEPAHMGAVAQKSLWWSWQAPVYGSENFLSSASLVSNIVLAVYSGDSLASLSPVAKGTNSVLCPVNGGQTYHIASAMASDAVGDAAIKGANGSLDSSVHIIPGNLLQEPSWEGTALHNSQYWHWSLEIGGYVNQTGGVDGTTWPTISTGNSIWQDFATTPGHAYSVRFAFLPDVGNVGEANLEVLWNSDSIAIANIPAPETNFWHWPRYLVGASNSTSRITFHNLSRAVQMDAFSVVDVTAPPTITTQPASVSSISGGSAVFQVGASGTPPLVWQWLFNNSPLSQGTDYRLLLSPVSTNQAGDYCVIISNAFGAATSSVANLYVDAPIYPTLLWQPYGDIVSSGGYYSFSVGAAGTPPLAYQWYLAGAAIADATNRTLALANVQSDDAGSYQVTVQNAAGTVWSLAATLLVTNSGQGGGTLRFQNNQINGVTNANAPVFDLDGLTRLNGGPYRAQLYAGPAIEWLRPAGQPVAFQGGFNAGYVASQVVTLANVPLGGFAVAQVRAWDSGAGSTYEEARAMGGRFGRSAILSLQAGGGQSPPAALIGLQSFNLQPGLPGLNTGVIQFVGQPSPDLVTWSLTGDPNYRYLIEKASADFVFRPYLVITNTTGSVTFTDPLSTNASPVFFRARVLD